MRETQLQHVSRRIDVLAHFHHQNCETSYAQEHGNTEVLAYWKTIPNTSNRLRMNAVPIGFEPFLLICLGDGSSR
jgi:hypothetical protein